MRSMKAKWAGSPATCRKTIRRERLFTDPNWGHARDSNGKVLPYMGWDTKAEIKKMLSQSFDPISVE